MFLNNLNISTNISRDKDFKSIFINIFSAYEQVRQKYHSEGAFPHLYEKIKPEIDVLEVGKAFMDPL